LDQRRNIVGCLLHPAQNHGRDLRDLTGYGDKCRRELCREAVVFSSLTPSQAALVLGLTEGLDSFTYSSEKKNPAFRLLLWGPKVIEQLADLESNGLSREDYQAKWSILDRELDPARDGYPVELLLERYSLKELARPGFLPKYRAVLDRFVAEHRRIISPPLDHRPFVHQVPGPASLARFMRTALGWDRAAPGRVRAVVQALAETMARDLTDKA